MIATAQPSAHIESTVYAPVIRRERDTVLLNALSADQNVHDSLLPGDAPIYWPPETAWRCVILSNCDDAAMVFEMKGGDRAWMVATVFGPTCRGAKALATGRAMRDYMIPKWADAIFGPVPDRLPAAKWFYRQMGGRLTDKVVVDGVPVMTATGDGEQLFALGNC